MKIKALLFGLALSLLVSCNDQDTQPKPSSAPTPRQDTRKVFPKPSNPPVRGDKQQPQYRRSNDPSLDPYRGKDR